MAYCTTAQVKSYLGITGSGDDALLATLIAAAQAHIDAHCERTFEAESDTTRYCDAIADVDGSLLILPGDLCAITSVTNGDSTAVSGSSYVTEPRRATPFWGLRLKQSATISWTYSTTPENAIAIVGRWAYSTSAPDDVVQACIRLAAYLYRQKDNAADLDRGVVVGNATLLPATIPADIALFLRSYVRVGV